MPDDIPPDQVSRMQMLQESQERADERDRLAKSQKPQETTAVTPESKTPAPERQTASTD